MRKFPLAARERSLQEHDLFAQMLRVVVGVVSPAQLVFRLGTLARERSFSGLIACGRLGERIRVALLPLRFRGRESGRFFRLPRSLRARKLRADFLLQA